MTVKKAKPETIEAPEIVRQPGEVQVSDFQLLTGPLVQMGNNNRIYDTAKGRLFKQIYKSVCFNAKRAYDASRSENETAVADTQYARLLALDVSTSPYKDGIDASPVEPTSINPLTTHRPRLDLLFEIMHRPDQDEAATLEKAAIIKLQAQEEQAAYLAEKAKKNPTPLAIESMTRHIQAGMGMLTLDDGTYDAKFLTEASQFVVDYPNKFATDEDQANIGIITAALEYDGKQSPLVAAPAEKIVVEM